MRRHRATDVGGGVTPLSTATSWYTVHPNGTGSLTVTFNEPPFGPFISDFAIVNPEETQFVLSDAGHSTVASGMGRKQRGAAGQ